MCNWINNSTANAKNNHSLVIIIMIIKWVDITNGHSIHDWLSFNIHIDVFNVFILYTLLFQNIIWLTKLFTRWISHRHNVYSQGNSNDKRKVMKIVISVSRLSFYLFWFTLGWFSLVCSDVWLLKPKLNHHTKLYQMIIKNKNIQYNGTMIIGLWIKYPKTTTIKHRKLNFIMINYCNY